MDSDGVLITGCSGFLGMELLARYLERTERPIYALVRARDEREAGERLLSAARGVVADADRHRHRLIAVRGELTSPGLGIDPVQRARLLQGVTEIVHSAASVSFTLPLPEARAINAEGTRQVLELADRCPGLRRLSHVSTAYVAGEHDGPFREEELELGQSFRNTYELSKWEAERLVRTAAGRLPVTVFRPSIVVGEADSGWTPAFNVMYGPLRVYARGSLGVVPARNGAPVDVVPAGYVADAIFELAARAEAEGRTYALAAGPSASNVRELIELSAAAFGRRPALPIAPALYRRAVHPFLLRRGNHTRRRRLRKSEVYFPYFDVRARFDTSAAREALEPAGIRVPPLRGYFDALVHFARTTEWGRRPLTRVQARQLAEARIPAAPTAQQVPEALAA